jgi:hypothetical protein
MDLKMAKSIYDRQAAEERVSCFGLFRGLVQSARPFCFYVLKHFSLNHQGDRHESSKALFCKEPP